MTWVFKIIATEVFSAWGENEPWPGSDKDRADGFVHLSAAEQVAGTLARHYTGREDLLLLWLAEDALPADRLRWEPSRGGASFPHFYGALLRSWVSRVDALPLVDGRHHLPPDLAD